MSRVLELFDCARLEGSAMKTVEAKISEGLDRQIDALVEQGWFRSRDKVLQEAIRRFLESHRPELMERFVREDIEWGLRGRN
jgi:Arc/MetJ-type ribon-helix-helix transcriptional regulator